MGDYYQDVFWGVGDLGIVCVGVLRAVFQLRTVGGVSEYDELDGKDASAGNGVRFDPEDSIL